MRPTVEYIAPIQYMRAPFDIELWVGRLGGASLEVCYEVYSPEGTTPRTLYTRAASTVVMVRSSTGKPVRMPDEVRAAWSDYVEDPVVFTKRG